MRRAAAASLALTEYVEMANAGGSPGTVGSHAAPSACVLRQNGSHVYAVESSFVEQSKPFSFVHFSIIVVPFDLKFYLRRDTKSAL